MANNTDLQDLLKPLTSEEEATLDAELDKFDID